MSVSIYYTATRDQPLPSSERLAIDAAVPRFAVEEKIEEYCRSGNGLNWESFCVYDSGEDTEPGVIFEGATKLPDNSEDAMWVGLQHWCHLLSDLRLIVSGANWRVHVDDHDLVWDDDRGAYDPFQ